MARAEDQENELLLMMSRFHSDPLGFVQFAFPWGEPGTPVENMVGPQTWQADVLLDIGAAISSPSQKGRFSVASGKGIGKSAEICWIALWALCTTPNTKVVITAGTEPQLRTKTMTEMAKWFELLICKHWFKFTATSIYVAEPDPEKQKQWRLDAIPWNANNPEAFAGLHNQGRRIVVLFDEACHDDQTDVLTNQGWRRFADLDGTESLMTKNPTTGECFYERPTRIFRAHRKGKMLRYKTRGVDVCVTPHHKMWAGSQSNAHDVSKWRMIEAQKLERAQYRMCRTLDWRAPDSEVFVLPGLTTSRKTWPEMRICADAWMEILGWFFSEGHINDREGAPYSTVWTQKKDRAPITRLAHLLTEAGFSPKEYETKDGGWTVQVHNLQLGVWLKQFGENQLDRVVPRWVLEGSARQIGIFVKAYAVGDGYARHSGRDIIYTSSKAMADGLQEAILKSGAGSTIVQRSEAGTTSTYQGRDIVSSVPGLTVSVARNQGHAAWRPDIVEEIDYDGEVFCAEMPSHHLLFTRRGGNVLWSGNSQIADPIWDTTDGIFSDKDTEVIQIAFGNPTRGDGRFRGTSTSNRWKFRSIDSRTVSVTDKEELRQLVEEQGEESDYVRVNVRGLFPRVSSMQFISNEAVREARKREVAVLLNDPLIFGVDVARFGSNRSVIAVRKGRDCRLIPWKIMSGNDVVEVSNAVAQMHQLYKADAIHVDEAGVGGGVVDILRRMNVPVRGVQAGAKSDRANFGIDQTNYANKRTEMWGNMREELPRLALPDMEELEKELVAALYGFRNDRDIQLVSKEIMFRQHKVPSPDLADALALTFAYPVQALPTGINGGGPYGQNTSPYKASTSYDPFAMQDA